MMNNRIGQQQQQQQHQQQHQQQQQDRFQMHDQYQQKYDNNTSSLSNHQYQDSSSSLASSRPPSRQQQQQQQQHYLYNYPTSINITAPSPMGSVRDMSRASLASSTADTPTEGQKFTTVGANRASVQLNRQLPALANMHNKRHSHQDVSVTAAAAAAAAATSNNHQSADYQLADRTSQMSLSNQVSSGAGQQEKRSSASMSKQAAASRCDVSAREGDGDQSTPQEDDKSRSKLIDELLKTINDDSFNDFIDFNNRLSASANEMDSANANRPKSAIGIGGSPLDTSGTGQLRGQSATSSGSSTNQHQQQTGDASSRPRTLNLNSGATPATNQGASANSQLNQHQRYQSRGSICVPAAGSNNQPSSTFDNVIRRMSTNIVQNFNKMSGTTLGNQTTGLSSDNYHHQQLLDSSSSSTNLRREKSSTSTYTANSLYVDNQVPARRHSDNTINVPRIQVALSSPQTSGSRANLNMRAGVSATKLANKWKLTAKTNQREASDKLSPNLGGALGYIRRHSSGNTKGEATSNNNSEQNQSNGLGAGLLNMSPFKVSARKFYAK